MKISAIAIISKNNGIGKDNKLLFHIPGELPRFKRITMGHPVIMGRKTFESIGRVLPGRTNIIITRDSKYTVEGATVVNNLEQAIIEAQDSVIAIRQLAEKQSQATSYQLPATDENEVFILGGGQIFHEAMPRIDRLYLTIVDKEVDADVFFPDYSAFTKVIEKEEKHDWDYPYTFLTLEKVN